MTQNPPATVKGTSRVSVYILPVLLVDPSFFRIHFSCVALSLIFQGYEPVNPASIDFGPDETENATWEDYMRVCLPMLATCDYIFLLSGWEKSRGARLEKQIADALGIREWPPAHNNVTQTT